jgi:iron complex outermembrane recepter protein
MKNRGFLRLCMVSALALAGESAAFAQAAGVSDSEQIDDIVVTAQKREQTVQTVPIAISAVTASELERRSATNITDIVSKAPGVEVTTSSQGGGNAGFFIRGIGQFDFIATTDPGVGVYLDGVYIARTAGGALDLLDIDRVEVLRGPQGTLFGKNAVGGAISVYTLAPDATEASGKVLARVGENYRMDVGGTINLPLVADKLAVRFSGLTKNQRGYGKSLFDGQKMNGTDQLIKRGALRWTPSSAFSAELAADWTHVNEDEKMAVVTAINSTSFVTIPQNQFALANGLQPYDDRFLSPSSYRNYSGFHPGNKSDIWGTRLTLSWDIGGAELKSITAYRDLKTSTGLDFDASPYPLGDQTVDDDQNQFSQELVLTGKALADRLDYAIGGYYLREKGFSAIYLPLSYAQNPDGFDTYTTNDFKNRTAAVFAQGTYKLTDGFSVTAGGRYSYEKKIDTIETYANKFFIDFVPPTRQSDSWKFFTWRLAAQYEFNRDLMAYASAATGFKSGGFNGRAQSVSTFLAFDQEKAITYELGLKSRLFDRRVQFNAALFQTDYKNIQTTLNLPDPATGVTINVVGNPADARIRGAEVEGLALIGRGLSIDFSGTYLDNQYRNIVAGADIDKSDKLPDTPKWALNAGGQYQFGVPVAGEDTKVTARLDWSYKSSFHFNAQNSIYNFQKGYSVFNGRLGIGSEADGWNLALYGKNLFDKRYATHKEDLMAFVYAIALPAPPREIGVEFTKSF